MPVMMGFAGLGIEVGSWVWQTRAMQGVADAAAVSAADALAFGTNRANPTAYLTEATSVAAVNGWKNGDPGVTITVNNPPKSGSYLGNTAAVEVIITKTATNWFSAFLPVGYAAPTLKARSVALSNPSIDCILSLSNANTIGVNFAVTTLFGLLGNVNMPNCSIGDNAQGPNALAITGLTTTVTAYTATVYGGISNGLLNNFNFTRTPAKNSGFITPDPYICPGVECRTMPVAAVPATLPALPTTPMPTPCAGAAITKSGAIPAGCSLGIAVGGGNVTLTTGGCSQASPCVIMAPFTTTTTRRGGTRTTFTDPAINVTGGTLTINGGGWLTILGESGQAALSVSGNGNVTINTTTNVIQGGGGTGGSGIAVSGGSLTINAVTNNILGGPGGSGTSGISVSGTGRVTLNATTNNIQGGTGGSSPNNTAINVTGSQPSLRFGPGTNNILAGRGSAAITVLGTSGASPYARLTFANGTNNIQGASGDNGRHSAMTIAGFGNVTFGNGNTTFGGPRVTANVPAVNDDAGFLASPTTNLGLTLGSGTFQFMEGLSVTGGNLVLNPPGTSAGVGYYIMHGGSNGGLNMTFGDLIGTNSTIVLTGSGGDYANLNVFAADGITLTAPRTGSTAGIAIFQDPAAPPGNTNFVNGLINFVNITGAVYTPSQALEFGGGLIMNSQCMQLIASTITILGLASIDDQCEGTGTAPIGGNGAITLVE